MFRKKSQDERRFFERESTDSDYRGTRITKLYSYMEEVVDGFTFELLRIEADLSKCSVDEQDCRFVNEIVALVQSSVCKLRDEFKRNKYLDQINSLGEVKDKFKGGFSALFKSIEGSVQMADRLSRVEVSTIGEMSCDKISVFEDLSNKISNFEDRPYADFMLKEEHLLHDDIDRLITNMQETIKEVITPFKTSLKEINDNMKSSMRLFE